MTTRTDIIVDYGQAVRVAEVASPSIEFTMQDVVDTLRVLEANFQGMGFSSLLGATGKQDLGGGTLVGITVALEETKIAFEARTAAAQIGTVTTGSGVPVIVGTYNFIDLSATFIANGVVRGSLVINFTDQSIADVVEVISETELRTKVLVNGIGNTYDFLDVYHVFNVVQVTARGGNLTAVDNAGDPVSPILPTAFTQVIIELSSSATLSTGAGFWDELLTDHTTVNTFGWYVGRKLLSIAKFIGLK